MVTWRFVEMQLPVEVSLSNTYFSLKLEKLILVAAVTFEEGRRRKPRQELVALDV